MTRCLEYSPCARLFRMQLISGICFPANDMALLLTIVYPRSLPRHTPNIEAHIDATIRSLGLQDVANNKIGTPLQRGISGGQKRRVTLACSVIARPRVLVLDEPTSGLDSGSAQEVMASSEFYFTWIFERV
jgi:ABC-type Mn2+/Zn2+ transport system ATPase subunit